MKMSLPLLSDHFKHLLFLSMLLFFSSCQRLPTAQSQLYQQKLFDRKYTDLSGAPFTPGELKAEIIIFNFWASWCIPCIEELPSMLKLKQQFSDRELVIISINTETENQLVNIKKMHQRLNIKKEFIHVADQNTMIADSAKFTAIPVSVIFKNNRAIELIDGPTNFSSPEFIKKIKRLAAP